MVIFFNYRLLFWEELDPLTCAVQLAIDADNGFTSDHIFYRLLFYGLQSLEKSNQFEWPEDIIQFSSSLEAHGGQKVCNLIRGPGKLDPSYEESQPLKSLNLPMPSKTTRQRRKTPSVKDNGVITQHLISFIELCQATPCLTPTSTQCEIIPVVLARDAMAIKPAGDFDPASNTIIGLSTSIDLQYVKNNPYPDPDSIRSMLYTEAGAIIATTLDNQATLHLAHDFLLHKTTGDNVFDTLSKTVKIIQSCWECISRTRIISVTEDDITCRTAECQICIDLDDVCDSCSDTYTSVHAQLRPCLQCLATGTRCKKIAVVGIAMDCEANNAYAMRKLSNPDSTPLHMTLVSSLPDVVHAGKKLYRASSNWWLLIDGYRVNNSIIRSLRQFETSFNDDLRQVVGDKCLRNRDRMDYGSILQATDPAVNSLISSSPHAPSVTVTLLPDPFWRAKTKDVLQSITDICPGKPTFSLVYVCRFEIISYM